jgi:tetratricopeptide (TPR) repeat protein/DNA-binding winged helix-turn-helix (wHTH) protein
MTDRTDKLTYRLADAEVDPLTGLVKRNGHEHYLRPKTLQVLLYLIEERSRLVSKEELLGRVWQGTAVTDDALVQSIVEIRKVLGDSSQQSRLIKTFPKAGYRFIGEVEALNGVLEVEEVTSVEIKYEEEWGSGRVGEGETQRWSHPAKTQVGQATGISTSLTLPLSHSPTRKLLIVFTLALLLPLGGYLYRRAKSGPHPTAEIALPRVAGKRAVAVLYFENQSGDSELDWLREGLADMLITNLSRSRRLTLLSRQQLAALLNHIGYQSATKIGLAEGQEIGRRAQAEVLILGRFARLGEQVRIDVSLHEARTGQLQAAESLVAERPEMILSQLDLLALKLATHLGAAPAQEETHGGLAAVMTSHLDAYRYYSLALEQAQMQQFNEAVALLEKALVLDPQFAMAHARIGYLYAARLGQGEKAHPYLAKALQLSDRLNERDRLFIAAWSAHASYDPERVIATYRELLSRYPLETEAYQWLSWALQRKGRNEEALQVIRQGLLTDPEGKDLYNALGTVCMRLGRYDEALAAFQRYIQLAPNDPNALDSLAELHQWLGQYEQAAAAYSRALALNPESRVAVIHLGNLYLRQGRYRAAVEQYQRHLQIARDDLQRGRSFQYIAWLYLKQGDRARAAAAISEEVKYDPTLLWNSLVQALARGEQAAVQKLSEANFTSADYNFYNERGLLRIWNYKRGYVALKQGRAVEAVNHFRAAVQQRPIEWYFDSFEDCLANAYLELGRLDEAIAEYERILKLNPNYPLAHYHLGQAYERKGDGARARAAYERFLQVWKDADADIPEVIEAQQRLRTP